MPLYEYECRSCRHRFERIQKFSDPPVKKCPSCRGSVRKLISAPGIQFKGSGWYVTDYARKGGSKGSEDRDGKEKDSGSTAKEDAAGKGKKAAPKSDAGGSKPKS